MRRRNMLFGLSGAALSACATRVPGSQQADTNQRRLTPVPPVLVRKDRILKTVVGLRPYRRGGFRLTEERIGDKHLIHNYGHAGDGVSLSWGCGQIAAEMARAANPGPVAILGAGVMGLTTGLILAGWGHDVTIYTDKVTPNTTSDIAGALILVPDNVEARIARLSHDGWIPYIDRAGYGVKQVTHRYLGERGSGAGPEGFLGRQVRDEHSAVLVDPSIYLKQIMTDFQIRGGRIFTKRFESITGVLALKEKTIINCTGLGAGNLFVDETISPVRGQLTHLIPQEEIDYTYIAREPGLSSLYMFPRHTSIVLGGTRVRGEFSLEPNPAIIDRMIESHGEMASWAGRPQLFT